MSFFTFCDDSGKFWITKTETAKTRNENYTRKVWPLNNENELAKLVNVHGLAFGISNDRSQEGVHRYFVNKYASEANLEKLERLCNENSTC